MRPGKVLLVILAAVALTIAARTALPDLIRYIKISRM
jgi:hypothetical protein